MLRAESAFLTGQKNPSFELIAAKVAYAFKPPGRNTNIRSEQGIELEIEAGVCVSCLTPRSKWYLTA
ncbi:Pre-mRNA-splicing factor cwf10 [Frankliniella fusca]|uniref:Pre-mRNA-splicing factor cwf10 n=1 Tax=Frankliniella fusca TaxID=407009 RepID=A0AAE1H718_9NEOP|nr:Pre-mRNA-splicing factor cwf10 [Frankliniella fusca]